uniref:Uncharacterized protein n=1 Tax=Cacopsylla melanoneura TaxID=428564 RepID=A0A8D8QV44_9HEMI
MMTMMYLDQPCTNSGGHIVPQTFNCRPHLLVLRYKNRYSNNTYWVVKIKKYHILCQKLSQMFDTMRFSLKKAKNVQRHDLKLYLNTTYMPRKRLLKDRSQMFVEAI